MKFQGVSYSKAFYQGFLGDPEYKAAVQAGWRFPGKSASPEVHQQMIRYLQRPDVLEQISVLRDTAGRQKRSKHKKRR